MKLRSNVQGTSKVSHMLRNPSKHKTQVSELMRCLSEVFKPYEPERHCNKAQRTRFLTQLPKEGAGFKTV